MSGSIARVSARAAPARASWPTAIERAMVAQIIVAVCWSTGTSEPPRGSGASTAGTEGSAAVLSRERWARSSIDLERWSSRASGSARPRSTMARCSASVNRPVSDRASRASSRAVAEGSLPPASVSAVTSSSSPERSPTWWIRITPRLALIAARTGAGRPGSPRILRRAAALEPDSVLTETE